MHNDNREFDRSADRRRRRDPDRRQRGPSPQALKDALDTVDSHTVPGTPPVSALTTVLDAFSPPFAVGERRVRAVSIRDGDPVHGEKRSDDHVSAYVVELPLAAVDADAFDGASCPSCGGGVAAYKYSTYHHIAGGHTLSCATCETALHSEEWG